MAFKFENLKVWQDALRLTNEVNLLVKDFPKDEMYILCTQLKRAADSVVLNIAEGSTGQSVAEFKRFLGIALRSAVEVVSCFFIARDRKYITQEIFHLYYNEYELLCKKITKLRASLE